MRLEPAPSDDPTLPAAPEARRRREREQWQVRRRLERQLHDGAALRASALALQLGLFRHRVPEADQELRDAIGALQDELHAVLQELREVAAQIYPPVLDEAGLGPALRDLAERRDLPLRVRDDGGRCGAAAEGAVYFALVDALAAGAGPLEVTVRGEAGELVATVSGAVPEVRELLADRARPLGGTVLGDVPAAGDETGVGGTIVARIPCE
ncbi:histidine kinase [Pseudonocardia xishanensis]|uniref:Histidine kinase n=1 Tax=Pseudonocardia xishanensis TaxID=630995 RepID=A0ABP8RV56_9PSEU